MLRPIARRIARRLRVACLFPISIVLWVTACSGVGGDQLRIHTYPPDFNYVSAEKLQSSMWQLAAEVRQLEVVLQTAESGETVPRETVLGILERMEESASALGPGNVPSNHPRIAHNVDRLRDDIRRARRGVGLEPPNYFWAGTVSGACRYCHAPVE
ncbi:MAG: hypothetical protein ACQGVK_00115 [Myxococcota bacterium]